jgi:signal transduction histidine kinase
MALRWSLPWRDAAISAAVFGVNALFLIGAGAGAIGWLLQGVSAAALLVRRRHPLAAFAVTGSAALLYYPLGYPDAPLAAGFVIALYTVARDCRRLFALGGMLLLFAGFPLVSLLLHGRLEPADTTVGVGAVLLATVAAGEAARARRERSEAAERRAAEAEASREETALRREEQERLRIARELHDVMAHQISLISVQAGAALHRRDPDAAFTALEHIRVASREALREFRSVLKVLRSADEAEPGGASLARLPELLDQVRAAGMEVRLTGEPPADLPPGVGLAAYRIVQESLSNVLRHAGAAVVRVDIRCTAANLTLRVDDDGAGSPTVRGEPGAGLRGMAERAEAVGGRVTVGRGPDGGFRVLAELPRQGGGGAR